MEESSNDSQTMSTHEALELDAIIQDKMDTLFDFGHFYDPNRITYLPAESYYSGSTVRTAVGFEYMHLIYEACYKKVLVETEQIPQGHMRTTFGILRESMRGIDEEGFNKHVKSVQNTKDRNVRQVGDTYLHPIMPLQSDDDQETFLDIGMQAFYEDYGFYSDVLWLPESAVDKNTINKVGRRYKALVLRDHQLHDASHNPMWVNYDRKDGTNGTLAIFNFDSGLSGPLSYDPEKTRNVDWFLINQRIANNRKITVGSDGELWGWHQGDRGKYLFLKYMLDPEMLAKYQYKPFDPALSLFAPKIITQIWDKSSWSDEHSHQLGRWKGLCECHNSWEAKQEINKIYEETKRDGEILNEKLDMEHNGWREPFIKFFLGVRHEWFFDGDVDNSILKLVKEKNLTEFADPVFVALMKAKMSHFSAETSCYGFFPEKERIEREIRWRNGAQIKQMIDISENLINKNKKEKVFLSQAA